MNSIPSVSRCTRRVLMLGGAIAIVATAEPAMARDRDSGIGDFFFRVARKLENPVPSREPRPARTKTVVRTTTATSVTGSQARVAPQQMGSRAPQSRIWDPTTQQWLPAGVAPAPNAYSVVVPSRQPSLPGMTLQPRPGGNTPVITDPQAYASQYQQGETRYLEGYGQTDPLEMRPTQNTDGSAASASGTDATVIAAPKPVVPQGPLEYGRQVPGKPGFVYPPGVEQDSKNMLDVRGLAAGQKVRDPRNGQMFLVP